MKAYILYSIAKLIRSIFFWVPKTETEVAMERISVILNKKEKLTKCMFSGKYSSQEVKTQVSELLELTNETKTAMSDSEYIIHDCELGHRKELVSMCEIIISDLAAIRLLADLSEE
jgi:hypothetical protein